MVRLLPRQRSEQADRHGRLAESAVVRGPMATDEAPTSGAQTGMAHPHEELITKFYTSFKNKDAAGMAECYHDDVVFSDPAFPELKGWQAGAMWTMLVDRGGADLEVTFDSVQADDNGGSAHWEAKYPFGKAKRPIHNKIDATFEFKDGKIVKHVDRFNFWRWSIMALGPAAIVLGLLPATRAKVQKEAGTGLQMYIKRKRLGPKK